MSTKSIAFFATHGDLVAIARELCEVRPVEFVHGGLFVEQRRTPLSDLDQLRPLETYLVITRGNRVESRTVPQRAGGEMYAIDQVNNPHSIALQSGGQFADRQLIAGQLGTVGDSEQSHELYALFDKLMRKRFEEIKSYCVGPEAAAMLDGGARLSVTPKSPQTYDLVR